MAIERTHEPKQRVLATLPPDGSAGRTVYANPGDALSLTAVIDPDDAARLEEIAAASDTGSVLFEHAGGVTLVVPPFRLDRDGAFDEVHVAPLVESLERQRAYAVFLLRLGGFAVGFFRGNKLVDSKVDQRFVKNKHRKGGQSSTRFARIRDKQVHELFEKACETSHEKLTPYDDEIEHVLLGGDRRTLLAFRKECSYFERFGDRLLSRILAAHGDPRLAMLESMPREVTSSDVYTVST
ncbi:MAG: Vms1/Ankzf1 family peptidyl-tRNA hydrolase [Dehalococcoidia bacterium]